MLIDSPRGDSTYSMGFSISLIKNLMIRGSKQHNFSALDVSSHGWKEEGMASIVIISVARGGIQAKILLYVF